MKSVFLSLCFYLMLALYGHVEGQNQYELLYLRNQFDTIAERAKINLNSNSTVTQDYYWYGVALKKQGAINKCINILEEGLQSFPDDTTLNKLLADVYFDAGNYTEAVPILRKCPDDRECRIKLARIHEFNNNYVKAIEIFQELYRNDISNILYIRHLGNNYYNLDSISKALFYYKKRLSLNPYDQLIAYKVSRIYRKNKAYQKSIEVCNPILAKDSTNLRFLKQTGYVYHEWKKYNRASNLFSKALALGDSSKFVYKYLGISKLGNHVFHSGRKHLLEAYEKDTNDFETCYFLGRAFLNSPTPGRGLYYLNRADSLLQPDPSVMAALYLEKQSIYSSIDKYKNAVDCYKSAYKYTQKPEYLFYIASIYQHKIKDKSHALDHYRLFLSKLPPEKQTGHETGQKHIVISLKKVAENNVKDLRKALFFEGKLNQP
ncbi:MAG: hypothetical protein KGY70_14900 [Bacteroidales bacterium]|nr:hypothetical protein [Bacteroidales bacterium]